MPRTLEEIKQEYSNLAFRAGNLQYEITEKTNDLKLLNDAMRTLNLEFVASSEAKKVEPSKQDDAALGPSDSATEGSAA